MALQTFDTKLFLLINHGTANSLFDVLMPLLSRRGYLFILPFLLYMFYEAYKTRDRSGRPYLGAALRAIAISIVSVALAEYIQHVLKTNVERLRPCHVIEGVRLLVRCPDGYSMPSGHAFSSFAFASPLFYLTRRYISLIARLYPMALAALIAYSRPYVGVHYPSDIAVGALLGALIAMMFSGVYERIALKKA